MKERGGATVNGKKARFVLVIAMVLVITIFVGCGAAEKKIDYTGQWKLNGGKASGIKLTAEQLVSSLGEISMKIETKGKITQKRGIGLDENGKWSATETGIIVSDLDGSNSITFTYHDGTLSGAVKGVEITLKK